MTQKNLTVSLSFSKSKNGNYYACMVADLGYTKIPLLYDKFQIAEIMGITVKDIFEMQRDFENSLGGDK